MRISYLYAGRLASVGIFSLQKEVKTTATRITLPVVAPVGPHFSENVNVYCDEISKSDVLTVLRNSKSVLKKSWCQYSNTSIVNGKTRHCINGSIFDSALNKDFDAEFQCSAHWIMGYTLRYVILKFNNEVGLSGWNDQMGRSKDEVLSLAREAISLVESDECVFEHCEYCAFDEVSKPQ